ncbi:MAG: cell division protein FtsB [Steroidobacteraceae bacterium]|nr:cell division protein FtsB [Steroidobacteraceae bacterium]
MLMKVLGAILLFAALLLQYRLWVSDEGISEVWTLSAAVASQRTENDQLRERNRQLRAEVVDLKQGLAALEERARHDLGMVGNSETFFQVVEPGTVPAEPAPGSPPPATNAAATR